MDAPVETSSVQGNEWSDVAEANMEDITLCFTSDGVPNGVTPPAAGSYADKVQNNLRSTSTTSAETPRTSRRPNYLSEFEKENFHPHSVLYINGYFSQYTGNI